MFLLASHLLRAPWNIAFFLIGMYVVVYGLGNAGLTSILARFIEWTADQGLFVSTVGMGFIAAFLSNPNAVNAMAEKGIDISHQTSNIIDQDILNHATLVVTLCTDAANKCQITPSHVKREHWAFDDPAKVSGTEEEKWLIFQKVRDEIETRIQIFARAQN